MSDPDGGFPQTSQCVESSRTYCFRSTFTCLGYASYSATSVNVPCCQSLLENLKIADVTFFIWDLITNSQILKIQKRFDYTKYAKGMKDCIFGVSSHVLWTLDHLLRCSRAAHEVLSRDGRGTSWKTPQCGRACSDEGWPRQLVACSSYCNYHAWRCHFNY